MKTIIKFIIILLIVIAGFSCVGVQYSSGIGIGLSGGPCSPSMVPNFNTGGYRGGYYR